MPPVHNYKSQDSKANTCPSREVLQMAGYRGVAVGGGDETKVGGYVNQKINK